MKKLLSLFLVLVTLLGILPTAAFAADSEEEALGEVNIYNGEYELGYLSINGSVRKQIYTYFLYEANDGRGTGKRPQGGGHYLQRLPTPQPGRVEAGQ